MHRRGFLATAGAGLLAGCAGGAAYQGDPTQDWPAVGRLVDADGLRVHAWEQGSGVPVILLHGASGNLRDFTFDLGPRIAQSHRAIAFDRPGYGYSERPASRGGDPAVQARVLQAAARRMGVRRPILVGHSWGAALAMAWALSDPDGVAGVVTVSGAVMPWSTTPMLAEVIGLDQLLIGYYWDRLQSSALDGGIERFVERIFRPQDPPSGYLEHVGAPLSLRPDAVAASKEDIGTINTALRRQAPDYGRLKMPVEIVSGTADFIIKPERQPLPFAERLRDSNVTLLDGVGHMAHHVRPDAVLDAVERLVARA